MSDGPSGDTELRLEVIGMTCLMCVKHVTQALQEVPGVSRADVTLTPPRAVVRYDPSMASPEAMKEAIRKAGYDASAANPASDYGALAGSAQRTPARPEDVASTSSIVRAMYECLSGPAGQPRDWDRFRSLFAEEARFTRAGTLADGSTGCKTMRTEEYIVAVSGWLVENGFHEREVRRDEERFANIAHVFSAYESLRHESDAAPFLRGTNSCQLLFDGRRWWILSVLWQHESVGGAAPSR